MLEGCSPEPPPLPNCSVLTLLSSAAQSLKERNRFCCLTSPERAGAEPLVRLVLCFLCQVCLLRAPIMSSGVYSHFSKQQICDPAIDYSCVCYEE